MSDGWFALGGAALGFAGGIAVEVVRQRSAKEAGRKEFQRSTMLELQEVSSDFLTAMTAIQRHITQGATVEPSFDTQARQDHARDLLRRIRILAARCGDRRIEVMAADVFKKAYGAQTAETSMSPAYDAWEAFNDYLGTLVR